MDNNQQNKPNDQESPVTIPESHQGNDQVPTPEPTIEPSQTVTTPDSPLQDTQPDNIPSQQPETTMQSSAVFPSTTSPTINTTSDQPKKSNKTFFAVLAAVLLLTAIAVFFIVTANRNAGTNTPQVNVLPTVDPVVTEPASTLSPEEEEVENVDITDTTPTDFIPVEEDLGEL